MNCTHFQTCTRCAAVCYLGRDGPIPDYSQLYYIMSESVSVWVGEHPVLLTKDVPSTLHTDMVVQDQLCFAELFLWRSDMQMQM